MLASDAAGEHEILPPSRPSPSTPEPHSEHPGGYRPFLDGLRAIAVLGVLIYHLDRTWLPGGYLGVDLFFVLSGYLITSLLVAERARTGRIDLPAFWSRRIRRLLPALLVVLVVTAVVVSARGDVLAEGSVRGDLLATLLYVANWHFITSGQSYFSHFLAVSPVRHMWSLAVEEQFYVLWPIVAAIVLGRFRPRTLAIVGVGVAVASAVLMALLYDPRDPSRAYYGTDSRIFEILIGALAAMVLAGPWRERYGAIARRLAWPAFVLVLGAFAILPDNAPFYYQGAAVGLAVAVAVLISGLEAGGGPRALLALRPLVLVGLVSYGLYLWHFPVITFLNQSLGPTSSRRIALLAIVLTAAASAISYVVVERPIRRRGMLLGLRLTPRRLLGVVPVASGLVVLTVLASTASGISGPDWAAAIGGQSGTEVGLSLTTPGPVDASHVTPGGPGTWIRTVGVVGDSVVVSAMPGLQTEAATRGWTLAGAAAGGCPIGTRPLYDDAGVPSSFNDACRKVVALHAELAALRPDVIVWEDLQSVMARRGSDGTLLAAGSKAWTADLVEAWSVELNGFLAAGSRVVIVMPPLRSQQAVGCSNVPSEVRCIEIQQQDQIIRAATKAFWSSVGDDPRLHLISVDPLICPTGVPCPTLISGMAVRISGYDQTHFTAEGARWFAPRFFDLVVGSVGSTP